VAESHTHAMTDELTSLPNRRSLATALTALSGSGLGGPESTGQPLSHTALLLVNVSAVDELNDSLGRHLGD
jgi:GGDEF domain-containing protein